MHMSRTRLRARNEANNWLAEQRTQRKIPPPIPTLCNQRPQSWSLLPISHSASSRPPPLSISGGEAHTYARDSEVGCPALVLTTAPAVADIRLGPLSNLPYKPSPRHPSPSRRRSSNPNHRCLSPLRHLSRSHCQHRCLNAV